MLRLERRCEVIGCDRKHKARGMCAAHYQTWRRGRKAPLMLPGRRFERVRVGAG